MNPNTVVRAYRELEHDGVVELRHGLGVFVRSTAPGKEKLMRQAKAIVESAVERLNSLGMSEQEIRRIFENELSALQAETSGRGKQ